ncbi:MAG: hypothetical protein JJE51_14410 [Thermoanaerobaculia bacterium]|nr:hypothetical protein [Thermoanaerobaculia bacterium]
MIETLGKRAAGELSGVASALRMVHDQIRENDGPRVAAMLTHDLADKIESLGSALDVADLGEAIDNIETFARANPAVFLGGAAAAGFVAARIARNAAENTGGRRRIAPPPIHYDDLNVRPLVIGFAALALGALLGALIPSQLPDAAGSEP